MCNEDKIAERVFLTRLWVRMEKEGPWEMANKGALGGRGNFLNRSFKAVTGHNGEEPRAGICTVANWEVSWRVLDHFIIRVEKCGSKITSPLQRWTRRSKVEGNVGTRLESLKKAKRLRETRGNKCSPRTENHKPLQWPRERGYQRFL